MTGDSELLPARGPRVLFSQEAVDDIHRQFEMLAPDERPFLWQHAALPEFADLRTWLDEQLTCLDDIAVPEFVSRLLDSDLHTQALAELAAGYVLRQPGYVVKFGPRLGQLTPDILVTAPQGPRLIVEVWRRGMSATAAMRNAAWIELARHIRRIAVPVHVSVSTAQSAADPPNAAARKRIVSELRTWLRVESPSPKGRVNIEGFVFEVVGRTTTGFAEMLPIRDSVTADRKDVVTAIERKVSRYRKLADDLDLPLLVVLSADPGTALDVALFNNVLAGQNSLSMTISPNAIGPVSSGPIKLRFTDAPPTFDPALSGVAWLEIGGGVQAEFAGFWHNPSARRHVQF